MLEVAAPSLDIGFSVSPCTPKLRLLPQLLGSFPPSPVIHCSSELGPA